MPMTKKGLLPNAYRFIHIAADGFEDRILKGRLYHDSREGGMPFIGLSEMILILEELFDEIHYPIKSVLAVSLGCQIRPGGTGLGKRMCEVTVRNYEGCQMGGDVSHPAVADRRTFINEFDLKEEIAAMLDPLPEGSRPDGIIIPRSFHVAVGNYGPATFVVRILFRRNATWQGTVSWREKRSQVNFRSFMELLLLMQEAVGRTGEWKQQERNISV